MGKRHLTDLPLCNDSRECFAKIKGRCKCLSDTDFKGSECPFRKSLEQELKEEPFYFEDFDEQLKGV